MKIFNLKTFENKKEGEEYIKIVRRSKIGYILNTFSNFFIFIFSGVVIYLLSIWILYGDFKLHMIEFIILTLYIFLILFFWFYFWYATYLLITSHRIEKHWVTYLLGNKKEILRYHEISKISYSYPSFFAKILNYGTLEIMAGDTEKSNIIFDLSPDPEKLSYKLKDIKFEYHKKGLDG